VKVARPAAGQTSAGASPPAALSEGEASCVSESDSRGDSAHSIRPLHLPIAPHLRPTRPQIPCLPRARAPSALLLPLAATARRPPASCRRPRSPPASSPACCATGRQAPAGAHRHPCRPARPAGPVAPAAPEEVGATLALAPRPPGQPPASARLPATVSCWILLVGARS
jgi:hypothetical protein